MDLEKDEFEQELEAQNAGNDFELQCQTEENIDKSKIKRITKLPHIKYDLKIDFEKGELFFFIYQPKIITVEAEEYEKKNGYLQKEVVEFESKLIFKKSFKIENNTIIMDNKAFPVPEFFNKDLVSKKDKGTFERIFYNILSEKIRLELEKYKKK